MQLLPRGFKSQAYRCTSGTVFGIVEGSGRVRIGGYFRATDIGAFVRVLQERFGVVAIEQPGRTLLRR